MAALLVISSPYILSTDSVIRRAGEDKTHPSHLAGFLLVFLRALQVRRLLSPASISLLISAVSSSVTISQLIMLFRLPASHATLTPLLGNFARALTVIVTSRMMLNLRHAASVEVSIDTLTTLRASGHANEAGGQSIVFRRPCGTDQHGLDEYSGTTPQV